MSLATTPTRIAGQPRQAGVKLTVFEEPEPVREEGAYVKFTENGQNCYRWVPMTYSGDGTLCGIVDKVNSRWPVPDGEPASQTE